MSSILSVYLSNHHDFASTWDYIARLQPSFIRIHQPTARAIWRAQQAAPNAKIMLRSWDIDDSNGDRKREAYADPRGAANKHLMMWGELIRGLRAEFEENGWRYDETKWHLGLINEPDPAHLPQIVEYTRARMEMTAWPLGVMVPSVGNFGIPGKDPNDWSLVKPLEKAILDGGHILMAHEYWQPEGPTCVWTDKAGNRRSDAGYLAWRHRHIPLDVPILIGESGANGFIYNRHSGKDDAGWGRFMSPEQYAAQVREYIAGCDTRVQGVCLYMTDYHSDQWRTFDTTPAHEQLLAIRETRPAGEKPHTVHIPVVVVDTPATPPPSVPPPASSQAGVLDPNVLMAILDIESGAAFGEGGRLIIRFEAHIFKAQLGNDVLFAQFLKIADERPWAQPQYYSEQMGGDLKVIHTGGQESEWAAFDTAQRIDANAALRSISMGRPQIMGFNAARVGYASAQAMFDAFANRADGESAQIVAFINYLLSDPALVRAVKERDWRTIAAAYNGSGGVDVYAPRLEASWRKRVGV